MWQRKTKTNQQGVASIMITMIMMLVITLVVLAFAQISRSEQRQALDNQLSAQAYYAAETGVNDAIEVIKAQLNNSGTIIAKPDCDSQLGTPADHLNPALSTNVSYTCVTINPNLSQLVGTATSSDNHVFRLHTEDHSVSAITITWDKGSKTAISMGSSCPTNAASDNFTPNGSWSCPFGVLHFDLAQTSDLSNLSHTSLTSHTVSGFAVPTNSSASNWAVSMGSTSNRIPAHCDDTTNKCSIVLTGLDANADYYLNTRMMYTSSAQITVTPYNAPAGTTFSGSEVQIDSTGKAQDVLRRVRVTINLFGRSDTDANTMAVEAGDGPCKTQLVSVPYSSGSCSESL